MFIDAMSWIGMLASLLRAWMLAKNRIHALKWSLCVDLWWIVWAVLSKTWALLLLNIIYVVLDVRTLIAWYKEVPSIL